MTKYTKKPIPIEAVKLYATEPGDDLLFSEEPKWLLKALEDGTIIRVPKEGHGPDDWQMLSILTLEGPMLTVAGDYILQGIRGEIYRCDPEIFEASYEKVEDNG